MHISWVLGSKLLEIFYLRANMLELYIASSVQSSSLPKAHDFIMVTSDKNKHTTKELSPHQTDVSPKACTCAINLHGCCLPSCNPCNNAHNFVDSLLEVDSINYFLSSLYSVFPGWETITSLTQVGKISLTDATMWLNFVNSLVMLANCASKWINHTVELGLGKGGDFTNICNLRSVSWLQ